MAQELAILGSAHLLPGARGQSNTNELLSGEGGSQFLFPPELPRLPRREPYGLLIPLSLVITLQQST